MTQKKEREGRMMKVKYLFWVGTALLAVGISFSDLNMISALGLTGGMILLFGCCLINVFEKEI